MVGKLTIEQSEELLEVGLGHLRERLEETGKIDIDLLSDKELETLVDLDFITLNITYGTMYAEVI